MPHGRDGEHAAVARCARRMRLSRGPSTFFKRRRPIARRRHRSRSRSRARRWPHRRSRARARTSPPSRRSAASPETPAGRRRTKIASTIAGAPGMRRDVGETLPGCVSGSVSVASGVSCQASISRTTNSPAAMILAKRRERGAPAAARRRRSCSEFRRRERALGIGQLFDRGDVLGRRLRRSSIGCRLWPFRVRASRRLDQRAVLRQRGRDLLARHAAEMAEHAIAHASDRAGGARRVRASKTRSHSVSSPNERLFRLAEPTRSSTIVDDHDLGMDHGVDAAAAVATRPDRPGGRGRSRPLPRAPA